MSAALISLAERLLRERGAGAVGAVEGDKLLDLMNAERCKAFTNCA